MLDQDILDAAATTGTASLHEAAGKIGALPSAIKPLSPAMRVAGRAFPVRSPGGDNLWLHRAIAAAAEGDVLVVATGGATEFGYWGEIMTRAAQARRLGGLVIEGGVRDAAALAEAGFPVFAHAVCIRGTGKDPEGDGALGTAVSIGAITVRPGDLVVGDGDGVVVLPAAQAAAAVRNAIARDHAEREILARLARGETTMDIYGLPRQPGEGA